MATSGKIAEAYVDIKAKTDKYEKSVKGVKTSLFSLGNMAKGVGIGLAVGAGVAVIKGIKSIIGAYKAEEVAVAKLGAVLKATGGAAGFSSSELQAHAQALQDVTTFSNDAIVNTEAILATFKNISGDEFKAATVAILDMSAVLDQDAKQGAIQLGKALNDPIKGITALNRVGVTFTKAQKDQIKLFQETNQLAKAQQVILTELESEFGGAAVAMRKTFSGALKGVANDFQDLGKVVVGAMGTGGPITKSMNTFSNKMREVTKKMGLFLKTDKWERYKIELKFIMSSIWLYISRPFKLSIALFRDYWAAYKKYIIDPNEVWLKALAKFGVEWAKEMFKMTERMKKEFADQLPKGLEHTKKALLDMVAASKKAREERSKGIADIGNRKEPVVEEIKLEEKKIDVIKEQIKVVEKVAKVVVEKEKEKQKAIKKTISIRTGGAEDIRKIAQEYALRDFVKKDENGNAINTNANINAGGTKKSIIETIGGSSAVMVLKKMLEVSKDSNSLLREILDATINGGAIII